VPALIIHGKDDRTVAPVNAAYLARQFLAFNGFDPAALPPGAALPRPGMLALPWPSSNGPDGDYYAGRRLAARVLTIAGLGHAWSGGDAAQPFFSADGPDATRLACEFFAAH
jgi:poly(3-hydroxybutyrate) depolymerase